jgi:RNA polymerase sigma-70 factor (ECF subfamily)
MSEELSFRDLILRVRAGDEEAAAQLVRRYEPAIRRAVQVRLHDRQLRRYLDSMDICQSVLASFFVRAALGQYQLDEPAQLLRLLATMARNKLANQANQQRAGCRDYRRGAAGADQACQVPAPGPSPSAQVEAADLVEQARQRLSAEELRLLELRRQGRTWPEIAAELGGSPDALRIRLDRAVERVTRELGLDEVPHE